MMLARRWRSMLARTRDRTWTHEVSGRLRRMERARMPRVQQPRKGFAIGIASLHRRLEQRFLDVARHVAPDGERGMTEQDGKSFFVLWHQQSCRGAHGVLH